MTSIIIFLAMLVFLIIFVVAKGTILVQQSEAVVVERLGQFGRILTPGVHLLIPGIDQPRKIEWRYVDVDPAGIRTVEYAKITRIDLRERVFDFPPQNVITRDNVAMPIDAVLYYQVVDPKRVVYEIENLPEAVEMLAQTSLRSMFGSLTLDESLASRETINAKLQETLDEATEKWGVKINRVELQEIKPPEDIRQAMEKEMRAERDKRAAILRAEGLRDSTVIEAEGEALARMRIAQAEAEAIKRISAAFSQHGADPTQYLVALRYIEALKEMVSGKDNKIVYLPFEATSLLGSLGGIKDLFQDMNSPKPKS